MYWFAAIFIPLMVVGTLICWQLGCFDSGNEPL